MMRETQDRINSAAAALTIQDRRLFAAMVEVIAQPWEPSPVKEALLAGASALRRNTQPDLVAVMEHAYRTPPFSLLDLLRGE